MKTKLPSELPLIAGPYGKAWKIDLEALAKQINNPANATLGMWVVNASWAHPLWHSYCLSLIHVRPIPGTPPPIIHLEGATHEMWLFALNPDYAIVLDRLPEILNPMNFGAQFIEPHDLAAIARIEDAVREIVRGELSPDTDYTQQWIKRFGFNMIKGDPSRAGETIIEVETVSGDKTRIVHDPKPVDAKPKI
jgi:hypothetical protein